MENCLLPVMYVHSQFALEGFTWGSFAPGFTSLESIALAISRATIILTGPSPLACELIRNVIETSPMEMEISLGAWKTYISPVGRAMAFEVAFVKGNVCHHCTCSLNNQLTRLEVVLSGGRGDGPPCETQFRSTHIVMLD
ncbi:hypothetical protein L1987_72674 [Smallanthus sonchifolius]|uniref:Uncharacterized protein n=1 Tax=Smallanthus sonchifolius TaxID=185202 RepID=A0ACB9AWQ8_9ASTR|nr:hypothetical protein L1987_72674 [Smallanthus sonchifolius]